MARTRWSAKGAASLAILVAICAHAYVRSNRGPSLPYFVGDPAHVEVFVNSQTQAGLKNVDGGTIISNDSAPTAAVLAALERWSSIPGSALRFDTPVAVLTASGVTDGKSVITFADTPSNRQISAGAVAVTRLISNNSGELTDTDVIFNPQFEFSTTLQAGTFDIEGTLVHELGHALGMSHAGSTSSTMFATTATASADLRSLVEDDMAFARGVYPAPGRSDYGSLLIDVALSDGQPARGALVTAIDRANNRLLTGLTDTSGRAEIAGVPAGEYVLYAEPANEPALPGQFSQFGVLDSIATTFAGGPDLPTVWSVLPGNATAAALTLQAGSDAVNLVGAGGSEIGGIVESDYGFIAQPGGNYTFELFGDALDDASISLSSISFLGTGVSVEGPLERDEIELTDGAVYPLLRFRIAVSPSAPVGSISAMIRLGDQLSLFTGALEIADPTPTPTFLTSAVVNAASFETLPLSPGGIFSIFGENLAPAEGSGFFDPLSGRLIESLRGVTVLVDNRPAPLFFVSPGQINAQAPPELQPGDYVSVRVLREHVISANVLAPAAASSPGVFVHPESTRVIALNEDGTLNSAANPADRGSVLTFYLTGAGTFSPSLAAGQPAPLPPPLHHVAPGVEATIDNLPAAIEFAGAAPGFVGLVQINVRVPAAATGDNIVLRATAGSAASQPGTTISIR